MIYQKKIWGHRTFKRVKPVHIDTKVPTSAIYLHISPTAHALNASLKRHPFHAEPSHNYAPTTGSTPLGSLVQDLDKKLCSTLSLICLSISNKKVPLKLLML